MRYLFCRLVYFGLILIGLLNLIIIGSDILVVNNAKFNVFDSVEKISHNKVGVVLGTVKHLKNGRINLYYKYRVEAAYALYEVGKIDFILISGDNSRKNYDEPSQFKEDLVALGVDSTKIYLDYAGFRTWDSVIRTKKVFGESQVTFISQKFHNERALYIAKSQGMKCTGYNATDISGRYGIKVQVREKFARVKLLLDILLGKKPKFLGESIDIK